MAMTPFKWKFHIPEGFFLGCLLIQNIKPNNFAKIRGCVYAEIAFKQTQYERIAQPCFQTMQSSYASLNSVNQI